MANIDWSFLSRHEGGQRLAGYIVGTKYTESGVTVATGVDLGQRNDYDLKRLGLSQDLYQTLKPYLGLKGFAAKQFLSQHPLKIAKAEADRPDAVVRKIIVEPLVRNYNQAVSGKSGKLRFELLAREVQTIIVSVASQHGSNLASSAPDFWRYITDQNWQAVFDELMNFRDNTPDRRRDEGRYLKQWLNRQSRP